MRATIAQPTITEVAGSAPSRATKWQALIAPAVLLAAGGLAYLSLVASRQPFTDADLQISRRIQSLDFPGMGPILSFFNGLTDPEIALPIWFLTMVFLVLRGRPLEAVAVFMVIGLMVGDNLLSRVVDRPLPGPELGQIVKVSRSALFPSGHVTGAVGLYGLLSFLTLANVRQGPVRILVPTLAVLIIAMVSLGRIYEAAHWPSDVLGSYLWGFIGVVGISWIYISVKEDRSPLPRLRRKEPVPEALDGVRIARSIASTVYLDAQAGTATKEYRPPWPVRALYWLAFQAPFPYQHRKEALEAAAAKRKIAGLLTRYRFGYDMVAPVRETRNGGSEYRFVTEFVQGDSPGSNGEIAGTLDEVSSFFQEAGLPTWQVAPGNPHAASNFIRTPQDDLMIIDLESALVSLSYPWKQLHAALRDGNFPNFDDVDFVRLHSYTRDHDQELQESLGTTGLAELEGAIASA